MHFSLHSVLPVLSLLATLGSAGDSCDDPKAPYAPGTTGGQPFPTPLDYQVSCDSNWKSGDQIVGIEAWSAKFQLKAIKFKFYNAGWTRAYGDVPDDKAWAHDVKEWAPGDEVAIHITNNKPDDRDPMDAVGKVKITRGNGETIFDVGCANDKMQPAEIEGVNNGAGIILGAKVRSGAWVSSLEFKMLKSKIVKTELMEVNAVANLADWAKEKKGVEQVNIGETYFSNMNQKGGSNMTYTFANSVKRTVSHTRTHQWSNSYAPKIELKASTELKWPFIAGVKYEAGISFEYRHEDMKSDADTTSYGKDLSYSIGATALSPLQPQRAAHCQAWAVSGKFDTKYNGVVRATLADGSTYDYHSEGSVQGVDWDKSSTSCQEIDLKDIPKGVTVTQGEPIKAKRGEAVAENVKRAVAFRG